MENRPSIVRNGGINLPIGFRFRPTDVELIVHYLTRKVHSIPLPAQVIPELNVFQTNPVDLPGDSTDIRFFFWKRQGNWKRSSGMTEIGYWKPMGKEKHVLSCNRAIGVKKSFVFYEGKLPRGVRTQWVMQEYRLFGSQTEKSLMELEHWVVYKIEKKRTSRTDTDSKSKKIWSLREIIKPVVVDVAMEGRDEEFGPPQPSSSSCSCGVSFGRGEEAGEDLEEISSAYNFSSFFA